MEKIIKNKPELSVRVLSAVSTKFPKKWNKYKMFVGYIVACSLAFIFLNCWTFNSFLFTISLVWAFSFLFRLGYANIEIRQKSVIVMWSIFCFGLCGIIMQLFEIKGSAILSVTFSGFVIIWLYCSLPIISYYLKYNDILYGYDSKLCKTKYNGGFFSMIIFCSILFTTAIYEANKQEEAKEQIAIQQFNKEQFVPVSFVKEEMYNGKTIYILEAKGENFYVSPFEYPEVRNINKNSKVKVIFEKDYELQMKKAKKIQFRN